MDEFSEDELVENESEQTEVPEPQTETPVVEAELEADTRDKQFDVNGPQKIIDLILKRKKIFTLAVGGGIFIFFIILIAVLTGSGVPEYKYIEPTCKNVTVTYDPFGDESSSTETLDIEEYVRRAVYAYTKDFPEETPSDFHVYVALSIALRTEVMSHDCSVTYRDKELSSSYEERVQVERALDRSEGIVIVDENDNFIDVDVSSFCWDEVTESDYTLFQKNLSVSNIFTNAYLYNDVYATCPCNQEVGDPFDDDSEYDICWITWDSDGDGEDDEAEYLHQENETGFSLYGAYYLLKQQGYLYDHMLEYFFGEDIYFKTTVESNKTQIDSSHCSGDSMPYNSTPLSRSEFISLVEEYFEDGSGFADYYHYFVDYAGEIYDMGLDKNINPELIYIFARKETSFTAVNADTNHYNYYGYAHCNTCSSGMFFDSFMEGVETLFDYFVDTGSLSNLVSKYSYLGTLLYNYDEEAEMGAGGCYYLEIIYGDNYSRCDDSYYCSPQNTSGCVETTEEERQAYIDWQAEKYIEHRMAIFKLGTEVCSGNQIMVEASTENAKNQLKEPLRDFLNKKGLSIEDLNSTILNNVLEAGVGTREGVATAAITLINYMKELNVRIPYTYSGGHYGTLPVVTNKSTTSYYGVDPEWGTSIGAYKYPSPDITAIYTHYGPDCSAFVAWALHNGGIKISNNVVSGFKKLGQNYAMDGKYIGQIGDLVASGGHVRIIVSVNTEEGYYITAESQTNQSGYGSDFKGISYEKMNFTNSNYVIVDMSSYYDNSSLNYSKDEDGFIEAYTSGTLQ